MREMSVIVRKDTTIWEVIAQLASVFDGDRFQLVDHWDADLFAVGVASVKDERRLVYVSTYRKRRGMFDYDCEEADIHGESRSVLRSKDVKIDELVRVVGDHLRIARRKRGS